MSKTYINVNQSEFPEYDDCPDCLRKFLDYLRTTKNRSIYTVNSYYLDIRAFMRYLLIASGTIHKHCLFNEIPTDGFPNDMLLNADKDDIDSFLTYCATHLGNKPNSRAHKLSSLKTFYGYLTRHGMIENAPTAAVETPKKDKNRLPVYLTYDQCIALLDSIKTTQTARDYCIITLFLNCGMRISELVGIDMSHVFITEGYIRITGKGNKERLAYLNDACQAALDAYLVDRSLYKNIIDKKALFVSPRTGKRLTARGVEKMVEKCIKAAGLSGLKFTPHKFRHTAATLMHEAGVDMLTLQRILGHESVSTTEIYTHLNDQALSDAASASPLAYIAPPAQTKKER